ncbi:MAG: hypothetical protein HOP08_04925 [Cyclobacteriaceae bacterium]|nr:hypothetical protein [Cyclobacteriaceae bacterium]
MKKLIFLSGSVSAICISAGFFLKVLHWPVSQTFLSMGLMILLLVFVPLTWFYYSESNITRMASEKFRFALGMTCAILIGIGWVLKVCHLPGGDMILVTGGIILSFGFIPMVIYRMYKNEVGL